MRINNSKFLILTLLLSLSVNCNAQNNKIEKGIEKDSNSKSEKGPKRNMKDISAIMVSLEVEGKTTLWVLLAKDGSINRMGTGTEDNTEMDMYIGITEPELFEDFIEKVNPKVLEFEGEYKGHKIVGKKCQLAVGVKYVDGTENGSIWIYGTKSAGPPSEIANFVVSAVEITEPWLKEQKKAKKK